MISQIKKSMVLGTIFLGSCFTACTPSFEANYVDPHKLELIDDRWTQSDIDNVGVLIRDLDKKIARNPKKFGEYPTVILKEIENRTDEHIDMSPIKNKLIDELTNSDALTFVDASARSDISDEMKYQHESGNVNQATRAEKGKQVGAKLFLSGAISSTVNTQKGRKIIAYQVSLKLTNLEGGIILWSKQYSTAKDIKRASSSM